MEGRIERAISLINELLIDGIWINVFDLINTDELDVHVSSP